MESKQLLIKLREIYLLNIDEDGELKTDIHEIMQTWSKVSKYLDK